MKKILFVIVAALAIYSCGGNASKQDSPVAAQTENAIVDVNIDSLIANPSVYLDQTVRFSAMVDHVCKHTGQKITVVGTAPETRIKVMGSESVPTFEQTLNGAKVEVVGVVKGMATETVETCETDSTAAKNITYAVECVTIKTL
ncbi:MAG: hypothetical protein AB7S48_00610 [Bacteroidales bacterium]